MELERSNHKTIDHSRFVTTNRERVDRLEFYERMELRKEFEHNKGQVKRKVLIDVGGVSDGG